MPRLLFLHTFNAAPSAGCWCIRERRAIGMTAVHPQAELVTSEIPARGTSVFDKAYPRDSVRVVRALLRLEHTVQTGSVAK